MSDAGKSYQRQAENNHSQEPESLETICLVPSVASLFPGNVFEPLSKWLDASAKIVTATENRGDSNHDEDHYGLPVCQRAGHKWVDSGDRNSLDNRKKRCTQAVSRVEY